MSKMRTFVSFVLLLTSASLFAQQTAPQQNPPANKPAQGQQQNPPAKPAQPEAKSPAPTGPFKIGFINLEQALSQVEEGKKEFGELEKFVTSKRTQLESRQGEIDKLRKQLEAQSSTLNDEAKGRMQRDIDQKETEMRRLTEDAQRELESKRNVIIDKIGKKMQPLINTIAKEQNYAAIFIFSPQAAPLYAYIDLDRFDITNEVVKRYNVAHPPTPQSSSK